ncbi:universal stress protein [Gynurincola endophyticus]|jgi:nucleotide-binding universal stress UspA family protein|uniref:universal stress protein n=1 Tax=Gynurincola endophyticus TaxID=2479004 RepID=UPI000F8D1C2B|nr:universal stress protein [Gynurincola endophyticus]
MKKVLIPTDFSDTSKNAAIFAVQALENVQDVSLILYNIHKPGSSDSSSSTKTDRAAIISQALEQLKTDLLKVANVNISFATESGSSLVESIERYVRHNGIDLIIMGITGATKIEQIFMGSNTLDMVEKSICPVMIIPPDAKFSAIKDVVLASDFKDVAASTPVAPIKKVLELFKPALHIVNVDPEHYVEITEEYRVERNKLEDMFKEYNPEFYFIRQYDFLEAISQFAVDKKIDLIFTVPKKQGFVSGLFATSHTKKLAYHSRIPIVAIQE